MANVTCMVKKILSDYKKNNLCVNSALKYRFIYNGYETDVFYTTKDGLQNQLVLSILIDSVAYLSTLHFSKDKDEYHMKYYMSPELYKKVQFSLLYVEGRCPTTPYFETMQKYIVTHNPITVNHREELQRSKSYTYKIEHNNPYFKNTRRVKMSKDMREKIRNKYESNLASKIFAFCGSTKTLVFSPNIEDSKDIEAYMEHYSD